MVSRAISLMQIHEKKDAEAESLKKILCFSYGAARLLPSFDGKTDHYTDYETADCAKADCKQVSWCLS